MHTKVSILFGVERLTKKQKQKSKNVIGHAYLTAKLPICMTTSDNKE